MFRYLADVGYTAFSSLYCFTRQLQNDIYRQEALEAASRAKEIKDPYTSEKHVGTVNRLSCLTFRRINRESEKDEYTSRLNLLNKIRQQKKEKLPIAHLIFNELSTPSQDPWATTTPVFAGYTSLPDPHARLLITKGQYVRCPSETENRGELIITNTTDSTFCKELQTLLDDAEAIDLLLKLRNGLLEHQKKKNND